MSEGFGDIIDSISNFSSWWYLNTSDLYIMILYLSPILISYASCRNFSKVCNSGFLSNIVQRTGYKKTITIEILKCWKSVLVLPIISLIIFVICNIIFHNSVLLERSMTEGIPFLIVQDYMLNMNPYLFVFLYMIMLTLFGIIVINISIIMVRFIKNSYLVHISTLIVVITIETIGVLLLGPIASDLTGIIRMANGFSLYNLLVLDAIPSLTWEFGYAIFLFIITLIVIYGLYYRRTGEDI
jgi:hypothetical protein